MEANLAGMPRGDLVIEVGLVGPGRVGRALAELLPAESFRLGPVLSSSLTSARRAVRVMRRGSPAAGPEDFATCPVILIAVPDAAVEVTALRLSKTEFSWKKKIVLHSSGIFDSSVLEPLGRRGASVGSMHPLYVFQRRSVSLAGVHFTVEGNPSAVNVARKLIRAFDGEFQVVRPEDKVHHSIATTLVADFATGLLEAAVGQMVAGGFSRKRALGAINRLLEVSLEDYERSGRSSRPGPLLQGNTEAVRRHLETLRADDPELANTYRHAAKGTLAFLHRDDSAFSFLDSEQPPDPGGAGSPSEARPSSDG